MVTWTSQITPYSASRPNSQQLCSSRAVRRHIHFVDQTVWAQRASDPEGGLLEHVQANHITLLVQGGATVKAAQELARHSTPSLTLGVYTKLGVHDLTVALENLPDLRPVSEPPEQLLATGTDSGEGIGAGATAPPLKPQQLARETTRAAAASCDLAGGGSRAVREHKSLSAAEKRDVAQPPATSREKATDRTRTENLRFTKSGPQLRKPSSFHVLRGRGRASWGGACAAARGRPATHETADRLAPHAIGPPCSARRRRSVPRNDLD